MDGISIVYNICFQQDSLLHHDDLEYRTNQEACLCSLHNVSRFGIQSRYLHLEDKNYQKDFLEYRFKMLMQSEQQYRF